MSRMKEHFLDLLALGGFALGDDPYDPAVERAFKARYPKDDTNLKNAIDYWTVYAELYGTRNGHPLVRSLLRTLARAADRITILETAAAQGDNA